MDRTIPMLCIGLVFGAGIGFTVAAGNGITLEGHDHSNPLHHDAHAGHSAKRALKLLDDAPPWMTPEDICTTDNTRGTAAHAHGKPLFLDTGPDAPDVTVTLKPDPSTGWNLHIATTNFRFAPNNASRHHVAGEGHAHVYINGKKHGRVYGDWVHLDDLPQGPLARSIVRVGLYTNDHRAIYVGGRIVADEVVMTAGTVRQAEASQAKP